MKALHIVDDALHVSVSQIKTWLRCPRQYELRYVRGAEPEVVPTALAFGSAFHGALAAHYMAKKDGRTIGDDEMLEGFRAVWAEKTSTGVPLEKSEDEATDPVDLAVRMIGAFRTHAANEDVEVLAIEEPFAAVLHHPDTGEVLEEQLTGFIDLIVVEDGHPVVVEHKTSAKKYGADQLRFDVQLTGYQHAMHQRGWEDVGLRYQVVTKTKTPVVQVEDVLRDEGDDADFLKTVVGVLRAIDAGVFFPIRGWQCRGCQYRRQCGSRS